MASLLFPTGGAVLQFSVYRYKCYWFDLPCCCNIPPIFFVIPIKKVGFQLMVKIPKFDLEKIDIRYGVSFLK